MKILTNEYTCNTPNFKQPAKGGPANFARLFFNFLKTKQPGLEWHGLIINDLKVVSKNFSLDKIQNSKRGRFIYNFSFPYLKTRKILQAKELLNYRNILAEPIKRLTTLIKKISPDVVFLNGFSLGNWLILEVASKNNIPVLIQHAGIWSKELDIYHDFYSPYGIKMMKKMDRESSTLSTVEIFLNDFSRQYFDTLVLKKKRTKKNKFLIIPLPVDFSFFKKQDLQKTKLKIDQKKFNIGMVARWDRIKNHEAVAEMSGVIKDSNLPWSINSVTRVPVSDINARIKKIYRENINIIDFLTKAEIKDFCFQNDLIIIPSKFDVSPTILLEAVACGTPVAISRTVGFVDDYYNYGAGDWIIDFSNPQKAVNQLKKIRNKKLPTRLVKELIRKHDLNKVFEKYFSLISNPRNI